MKLGRMAWSILVIGILVIALVTLYMVYTQQKSERDLVSEELAVAQSDLPRLAEERANLESTLAEMQSKHSEAISKLETAKAVFPNSVESIEVEELLFSFANTWGLEITSLISPEPRDNKVKVEVEDIIEVEDVTYFVTSFTVDVEGDVADILGFVNTVVTEESLNTATVELANMKVPEPLTEDEKQGMTDEQIEEEEIPSASIKLVIYGYKGE